jgi:hypothetical protein
VCYGRASAAILTAGVAAPAFAVPRASSPVPLNGITQSLSGSQAGGIFCALPNLPVSVGITAAAGAIGETCGSTQVNSSSQSVIDPQQASAPQAVRQGGSQDIGAVSNLVPGNGNGGLNAVSNAVGGATGGLSGGSQP